MRKPIIQKKDYEIIAEYSKEILQELFFQASVQLTKGNSAPIDSIVEAIQVVEHELNNPKKGK